MEINGVTTFVSREGGATLRRGGGRRASWRASPLLLRATVSQPVHTWRVLYATLVDPVFHPPM